MSGRKNTLYRLKLIDGSSMGADITNGRVLSIQGLDNIGVQINVLTGTPTGEFKVQVSADHEEQNGVVTATGNWVDLTLSPTATVTSGSPTSIYVDLNQLSALYLRVVYTRSSGTGTCDVWAVGKMI